MLPIGPWIRTCGFALLVYMHAYTSKCKRNVLGPVWVHMVSIYTPDPSGKTNMAMEHPRFEWESASMSNYSDDVAGVYTIKNWTSKYTAAWSTENTPIFATSTGSMNVVDRECILPHINIALHQHKRSRICMKPFQNIEKDQFLFVCCTLPETNSSPLKIGRAPRISHHFPGASCLFYRVLYQSRSLSEHLCDLLQV